MELMSQNTAVFIVDNHNNIIYDCQVEEYCKCLINDLVDRISSDSSLLSSQSDYAVISKSSLENHNILFNSKLKPSPNKQNSEPLDYVSRIEFSKNGSERNESRGCFFDSGYLSDSVVENRFNSYNDSKKSFEAERTVPRRAEKEIIYSGNGSDILNNEFMPDPLSKENVFSASYGQPGQNSLLNINIPSNNESPDVKVLNTPVKTFVLSPNKSETYNKDKPAISLNTKESNSPLKQNNILLNKTESIINQINTPVSSKTLVRNIFSNISNNVRKISDITEKKSNFPLRDIFENKFKFNKKTHTFDSQLSDSVQKKSFDFAAKSLKSPRSPIKNLSSFSTSATDISNDHPNVFQLQNNNIDDKLISRKSVVSDKVTEKSNQVLHSRGFCFDTKVLTELSRKTYTFSNTSNKTVPGNASSDVYIFNSKPKENLRIKNKKSKYSESFVLKREKQKKKLRLNASLTKPTVSNQSFCEDDFESSLSFEDDNFFEKANESISQLNFDSNNELNNLYFFDDPTFGEKDRKNDSETELARFNDLEKSSTPKDTCEVVLEKNQQISELPTQSKKINLVRSSYTVSEGSQTENNLSCIADYDWSKFHPNSYEQIEKDENLDNDDEKWNIARDLNTDAECFNFVHSQWHSKSLPNPHKDMTYRVTGPSVNEHLATDNVNKTTNFIHFEQYFDVELKRLTEKRDMILKNIDKEQKLKLASLCHDYNRDINSCSNPFDRHRVETAFLEERNALANYYRNRKDWELNPVNTKIEKFKSVQNEISRFSSFYKNAYANYDSSFLSPEHQNDLKAQNNIFKKLDHFYSE